jgi:DNA-binding response OmpR family regulator
MNTHSDSILLLDHQSRSRSRCARILELLGYTNVLYRDYSEPQRAKRSDEDIDGVIAVWTDGNVERRDLLLNLMGVAKVPRVRGILVVSQFSTTENAQMLQLAGARAWVRFPFVLTEFASRLRFLLDGERRRTARPVMYDRRHEPAFPVPVRARANIEMALPG